MDSLFQHRLEEATLVKQFLRKKLWEDKNKELLMHTIHIIAIPQQTNMYDCGLYLLRSVEVFLKKRNRIIKFIKVNKIQ
jgi:Ulp1 family protease